MSIVFYDDGNRAARKIGISSFSGGIKWIDSNLTDALFFQLTEGGKSSINNKIYVTPGKHGIENSGYNPDGIGDIPALGVILCFDGISCHVYDYAPAALSFTPIYKYGENFYFAAGQTMDAVSIHVTADFINWSVNEIPPGEWFNGAAPGYLLTEIRPVNFCTKLKVYDLNMSVRKSYPSVELASNIVFSWMNISSTGSEPHVYYRLIDKNDAPYFNVADYYHNDNRIGGYDKLTSVSDGFMFDNSGGASSGEGGIYSGVGWSSNGDFFNQIFGDQNDFVEHISTQKGIVTKVYLSGKILSFVNGVVVEQLVGASYYPLGVIDSLPFIPFWKELVNCVEHP